MDQTEKPRAELNEELFPGENLLNKLEETPENSDQISELSKKGYFFLKEDNIQEAVKSFSEILKLEENNNYALVGLGDSERKQNHFTEAIKYYSECLKFYPENSYALFGLADCYRGMNQQYRSIEYWNKILDIDPQNKVILTRIGDALRNTGDYAGATEYYNKALNIDFDIYAALGLALICKGEGKYEEAIDRLSNLIKNDQKNYRLYIDLADCYIKLNKPQKAIEALESFQKLGIRSTAINELLDKLRNNKPLYN